jgi:hypothetical protein
MDRAGVYRTLLGSMYLDFDYFGTYIIMFFLGFFSSYFWRRYLIYRSYGYTFFSAYFLLILIFAPFYSVFQSFGFNILVGYFLLLPFKDFLIRVERKII